MDEATKAFDEHCKIDGTHVVKLNQNKVTGGFELVHTLCCFEAGQKKRDNLLIDMVRSSEVAKHMVEEERLRLKEQTKKEIDKRIDELNGYMNRSYSTQSALKEFSIKIDELNEVKDLLVRVFK